MIEKCSGVRVLQTEKNVRATRCSVFKVEASASQFLVSQCRHHAGLPKVDDQHCSPHHWFHLCYRLQTPAFSSGLRSSELEQALLLSGAPPLGRLPSCQHRHDCPNRRPKLPEGVEWWSKCQCRTLTRWRSNNHQHWGKLAKKSFARP